MGAYPILQKALKAPKPLPKGLPTNPTTIGEQIRYKRMKLGLPQSDVAKIIGVTTDTITNWELNRNKPSSKFRDVIEEFYRATSVF